MKHCYHTIITERPDGWFVGWVEEVRGTLTCGRSLEECRANLKESLRLILQTNRDEARLPLANLQCIQESIEIDEAELAAPA